MLSKMWTLATLMLLSCASTPGDATTGYLTSLQPVLQENGLLVERVLIQAAIVYNNDSLRPETVADVWNHEIAPLAEHVYNQASFVQPPPEYAAAHKELVEIWGDRASSYRSLGEAVQQGDIEAWNQARSLAESVKLREEKWFDRLNEGLASSGLIVDPYP
jgi:hypothetical protein